MNISKKLAFAGVLSVAGVFAGAAGAGEMSPVEKLMQFQQIMEGQNNRACTKLNTFLADHPAYGPKELEGFVAANPDVEALLIDRPHTAPAKVCPK